MRRTRTSGVTSVTPSVDRQILRLAVPAFAALIAEPLMLLADSAIIGHLGTLPLAGLGVAGAILSTAVGLFIFLAYGTTATVARQLGAGDRAGALARGLDGVWLAGGLGVLAALAGWIAAPALVTALGAGPDSAPYAVTYLRWSLPGLPAMLIVLAATGVLRGLQDARSPLIVSVAGATANVVLNLAFVYGLKMGIAGSGAGTALAQIAMATAFLTLLYRTAMREKARLRPRAAGLKMAVEEGVPLIVRTLTLRAALLITTFVAAGLGDVALAAHQVVNTLWTFTAFALDALAIAGQSLTGLALGAGDRDGARAATRRMLIWAFGYGLVLGGLELLAPHPISSLFSSDAAVRAAIVQALIVCALLQPLAGYVFVLDGVLIGAGDGRYLAWAGTLVLIGYAPMALAVNAFAPDGATGLAWLWGAFGLGFMGIRALTLGIRARGERWMVLGSDR